MLMTLLIESLIAIAFLVAWYAVEEKVTLNKPSSRR